jgi:signal transduction histidine kinase
MIANGRIRPELLGDVKELNPLVAQLTHHRFPEVADALRSTADAITRSWDAAVRQAMPQMRRLTFDELKDSTPRILLAIADALASDDPQAIADLVGCAPGQGLSRLRLNFDLVEVLQEDRLLRAIIVLHVETELGRRMSVAEAAALHADVDLMLQRSVIAMADEQKATLRAAAETELKFVSFLAHDMNNNLNNVTLLLDVLAIDMDHLAGAGPALDSLRLARQSIDDTVGGMRRMLDHERLRQSGASSARGAVDLYALATAVARQFALASAGKGVAVAVEVPAGSVVESDGELVTLVLQNLVGNGVKYSSRGTVRIGFEADGQSLYVSDDGPGIAPHKVGEIFEAFRRGEVHGQSGVGLGLSIASQGAKLLRAQLTVESAVGLGSTFRLAFLPDASLIISWPAANAAAANGPRPSVSALA